MANEMEEIFQLLDESKDEQACNFIRELLDKRDQNFIEDLVPSLSIITENHVNVVTEIMPKLLAILELDDDVIRYSMILSLQRFVEEHMEMIFPYIEDYLKYGTPKKREGMLLLLKYMAAVDPVALEPYYSYIASVLSTSEDYVRKRAVEVLQLLGKENRREIEAVILTYLRTLEEDKEKRETDEVLIQKADEIIDREVDISTLPPEDRILLKAAERVRRKSTKERADEEDLKKAADEVLKEIIDVSALDKQKLEKRQIEAESKALEEKLEAEEDKLHLEKLKLAKEQREMEKRRIAQEKERLEREQELLEKKKQLEMVRQELELKRIEEEQARIIQLETDRIAKKMKDLGEIEGETDDPAPKE